MRTLIRISAPLTPVGEDMHLACMILDQEIEFVRSFPKGPTVVLHLRKTDGEGSHTILAVCANEAEAQRAAGVVGRTILAAYDKWELNSAPVEEPLVLHFDAAEILRAAANQ